ncbi:hypothetical protein IE81DRAFT_191084 [Ceraceosorus guamensis]|uniref:Uncharacterized protein n=1 Tax=Ceraceosorus guamensis TaxID=1522189 RepID=A0A316W653_9BASI|nr:hypothetical protein IE81DRAFT_191084 [Ceraceosorus guamensis]PWN45440.1 hypothetical protein IE81DRAFT_191084 [Ceraceosorus guamensis]
MQSASSAATGGPRTSRDEYSTRQSYYLRISPYMVLLMSLFLDARDVRWMNSHQGQGEGLDSDEESDGGTDAEGGESRGETILAIALAHLKEVLMEKLLRESVGSTKSTNILAGAAAYDVKLDGNTLGAWSGKETVDIFEHPDFRMAFYFQRAAASGVGGGNRHAVLLKNKRLTFPHLQRRRRGDEAEVRGAHGGPSMPIPGPMNNQSAAALGGAALTGPVIGSMAPPPIPSKRRRAEPREDVTHDALQDVRIKPDPDAEPEFQPDNSYTDEWGFSTPQGDASQPVGARNQRAEEDEEEDKKPRLTVSYRGFRM